MSNTTLPVNIPFTDRVGRIDYRWLRVLQGLVSEAQEINPFGAVLDGSNSSYGQMTLFQGPDAAKSGAPDVGDIYFALDTRKIYVAVGGVWTALSEALTGDVIKSAGSTFTQLATVFPSPGTYGSATQVPVLTIDAKGRVTNLALENISGAGGGAAGLVGSLQFNNSGNFAGTDLIIYNPITGALTFANPLPTFNNLSPLTTKGDLLARTTGSNVRLPVGANGRFLRANSATSTGLEWADDNTIEVRFNFGDASPKPIATVPANRVVRQATITILTPFDDASATLSVSPGDLLLTTDVAPSIAGTYANNPGVQFGVNTPVVLNLSPGTSTAGSGLVTITLEE